MRRSILSGGLYKPQTNTNNDGSKSALTYITNLSDVYPPIIIEHIPPGTAFSGAATTITDTGWISRADFANVLIDFTSTATGGTISVNFSADAGVTTSGYIASKAVVSGTGIRFTTDELIVPTAGSAAVRFLIPDFPYFRVTAASGTGTSTTASCMVYLSGRRS